MLNELIGAAVDNLRIDDQLDLWAFANRLQTLQGTQIASYTVPADGKFVKGNAVLIMNEKAAEPILDYFRGAASVASASPATTQAAGDRRAHHGGAAGRGRAAHDGAPDRHGAGADKQCN